ncbi:uncharacterized protein TNCV_360191 [Trichonephila clavipes]|uniref:Uncharacterized protein n=1 Tax=Trichonephila clavipes TaxID=2585209 RepID=A0A8X6SJ77_TRICX|nr:uncharacterized protein TNCV_360191 [Trichonephila clavipes]
MKRDIEDVSSELDNGVQSVWEELKCRGNRPPCLQEHTMVCWKNNIYVFGGEIGFASTGETPLWILDLIRMPKSNAQKRKEFSERKERKTSSKSSRKSDRKIVQIPQVLLSDLHQST